MPVAPRAPRSAAPTARGWRGAVVSGLLATGLACAPAAAGSGQACDPASLALLDAGAPPLASACRDWPHAPEIRLVAAAHGDGAPGERVLRLVTAMVDPIAGRVLARHVRELGEDAGFVLRDGGLRLDTARYDLAPGVRAFGVVLSNGARGPSCPDRGYDEELTLLVRDGDALRPVFATWLETWEMVEGSACAWAPQHAVVERARAFIGIEPARSHGFADLSVVAQVTRETSAPQGEPAVTRRRARRVLRYDGRAYALDPFDNPFFWSVNPW